MSKTNRAPETAASLYAERAAAIRAELARIGRALDAHEKRAAQRPDDYGYAGDAGHALETLRDAGFALGVASETTALDKVVAEVRKQSARERLSTADTIATATELPIREVRAALREATRTRVLGSRSSDALGITYFAR